MECPKCSEKFSKYKALTCTSWDPITCKNCRARLVRVVNKKIIVLYFVIFTTVPCVMDMFDVAYKTLVLALLLVAFYVYDANTIKLEEKTKKDTWGDKLYSTSLAGFLLFLGVFMLYFMLPPLYAYSKVLYSWDEGEGTVVSISKQHIKRDEYKCDYEIVYNYNGQENSHTSHRNKCDPDVHEGDVLKIHINPKDSGNVWLHLPKERSDILSIIVGILFAAWFCIWSVLLLRQTYIPPKT